MNILFLTAEAAPFVQVGGLGDVAGSLPYALKNLSTQRAIAETLDIRLVIPFHNTIDTTKFDIQQITSFKLSHATGLLTANIYTCEVNEIPVYLIKGDFIDDSRGVYSHDAILDTQKYVFYSLAALEIPQFLEWQPHVIHANDWHTAPAVYTHYLNRNHADLQNPTRTLLTIHNLPYMGSGAGKVLEEFGIPSSEDDRIPDWGRHMPLPLGLLTADRINTVSPQYALDVLTPEFGVGLESLILSRRDRFSGILNGIDTELWNPETDSQLSATFDDQNLVKREKNKSALLTELGLSADIRVPLIGMINRMDYQKGVDIAFEALNKIKNHEWQAVILGSGDRTLEDAAHDLEAKYPDRIRTITRFDVGLSHRIYAGSDMILIPSRYEPCGLTQMLAMRYGSVPIARATGGLIDTVKDIDLDRNGTGILFPVPSAASLAFAIKRALATYRNKRRWHPIQKRGMKEDFTWKTSALNYFKLYSSLAKS